MTNFPVYVLNECCVSLITVATRGRCGVSDQGADHRAVRAHAQKHNHQGLNGTLTFSFPFYIIIMNVLLYS